MTVDCPESCSGTVIELATKRKGTLRNMESNGDRVRLEFDIPSRGIIGLRSNMLTATAGEAIMTHRLKDLKTLNESADGPGVTRSARFFSSSRSRRSLMWREVTYLPSLPKKGSAAACCTSRYSSRRCAAKATNCRWGSPA